VVQSGIFTPAGAIQSLEASLRELRTDYVDLLLLHEATLADAANSSLVDALQQQVLRGTVRFLGVASAFQEIGRAGHHLPKAYQVLQFDDNARTRNLATVSRNAGTALITHSIFQPASALQNAAATTPELVEKYSSQIDADLREPETIGSLLLHYALHSNANGIVLFSSSNPLRISSNVRDASLTRYSQRQLSLFVEFVDAALSPATSDAPAQRGEL
jgi:aryl-alcohol dehydrogenase-like predicted oxidoreductase